MSTERTPIGVDGLDLRAGGDVDHEEAVAIVAAIEAAWPRPALASAPEPTPRWRFSGRWWTKPIPSRRDRP